VVLAPPYYFPAGQVELLEYIEHLVPELPLPLFLYNMPSYTKAVFEPETVQAAVNVPGIVGLKDSSGDMIYFHRLLSLLKDHKDFTILMGQEELLAEAVVLGGHGGMCGGANLFPQLFVELYDAARSRDLYVTGSLHRQVMQISSKIYNVGQYESSYLKGLKCALSCIGICNDFMAEPFHRFRQAQRKVVQQCIDELGIYYKK
jgi:4-hydroxy-tetrahydrodipicolinate synthase